jgi:hypothetical protein
MQDELTAAGPKCATYQPALPASHAAGTVRAILKSFLINNLYFFGIL